MKITYIIADNSQNDIVNIIKQTITDVQFGPCFPSIEQVLKPGLVITKDSIRANIKDKIQIKRMRKKFLILCDKTCYTNKHFNKQIKTYSKIFDIYIEIIDTDPTTFKGSILDLFKSYKDIDYLVISNLDISGIIL